MDQVLDGAVQIAIAVVVASLAPLIAYAVAYARKALERANIQVSEALEDRIRQAAIAGVSLAAEQARKYASAYIGGKMPSATKLSIAVASVLEKVPGVTEQEATDAVHSVLPHIRATIDAGTEALGNAIRTDPSPQ